MTDSSTIVISLGGSLIVPDGIDVAFLRSFRGVIEKEVAAGSRFVIVVGGGKTCRRYQQAAREAGVASDEDLDWIGIYALRLNAELVRHIFGDHAQKTGVVDHPSEIDALSPVPPVIVCGAHAPGKSSDFDAVEFAEKIGARRIVNLSNTDYAYTKDPTRFPDAQKLESVSWSAYRMLIPAEWNPGLNTPFDPIASKRAEECGIEVALMNGKNLNNFENYLVGMPFIGTTIHP